MKFYLLICGLLAAQIVIGAPPQTKKAPAQNGKNPASSQIDAKADSILHAMSNYMASVQYFSVNSKSAVEVVLKSGQKLLFWNSGQVYLQRPNKLRVNQQGDPLNPERIMLGEGRTGMEGSAFLTGESLTVFGRKANSFATAHTPSTLDSAISFIRECLNIDAPGADLLYSDIYAGLMESVKSGQYLGQTTIDSMPCHHLAYRAAEVDWQIWIRSGEKPFPLRYMITSIKETGTPDFIVTLAGWNVTAPIPDSLFTFTPPKSAMKIDFLTRKCQQEASK